MLILDTLGRFPQLRMAPRRDPWLIVHLPGAWPAIALVAFAASVLVGCNLSDDPSSDLDDAVQFDPLAEVRQAASVRDGPEPVSCIDTVREQRWIYETASIAAEDLVEAPEPHFIGWKPGRLSDLLVSEGEFIALDSDGASVTLFSDDFRERQTWGRRGPGPSEFNSPVAVTDGGTTDTLWIVDSGSPPQVKVFLRDGTPLFSFSIQSGFPTDIARDRDGTIYVAHQVAPRLARSDPERFGSIVSTYGPGGEPRPPLAAFDSTSFIERRLVLPGMNQAGVEARGNRVAVFYSASGIIDLYEDGGPANSARVCFPGEREQYYRAQREAAPDEGPFTQSEIPLITGIRLTAEGGIRAITSFADADGRYHVDHFGPSGESLGSTVFDGSYIRLPRHTGFAGGDNRLVAFGESGLIATFELRDSPP